MKLFLAFLIGAFCPIAVVVAIYWIWLLRGKNTFGPS